MVKPFVTVIIVNWNGVKYLPDCLQSLSAVSYKNRETLFVDNASTDDSVAYVKKNYPEIKLYHNKTNLGYAQGHQIGLENAKGDAVLLLSTDTIVKPNVIDELIRTLYSDPRIGVAQPKLLLYGENNKIDSIGVFFLSSGVLYHYGRGKNASLPMYNIPMEIYSAKGACMLFKREVLVKTGLFDNDYFTYFEETDLCHRIWLAGYKIVYTPRTEVMHKGGGSAKQMVPSYIYFHSYKNRLCTYIKNFSALYLFTIVPKVLLLYELLTLVYLFTGKAANAIAVQKSILWNIFFLPQTLKKRVFVQSSVRKVNDKDFMPNITRTVRLSYYYYLFSNLSNYID